MNRSWNGAHPAPRRKVPWWNLRRYPRRGTRIIMVFVMVLSTFAISMGIIWAVEDESERIAVFTAVERPFTATVLSQDFEVCSVTVQPTGSRSAEGPIEAQTVCTPSFVLPSGSSVSIVEDPDEWSAGFYYVVGGDQDWQADAEAQIKAGGLESVLLSLAFTLLAWLLGYQLLLKHDRPSHVLGERGVKPEAGRFEQLVLSAQHASPAVRYTVICFSLVISVGFGWMIIADDKASFAHDSMLVQTYPHQEATLAAHEITGRSGEPAKVDVDGRRLSLWRDIPGLKSMNLGDTISVVVDPMAPEIAVPVDFANGPNNSSGSHIGTYLLPAVPGTVLMGLVFRVFASRLPLSMFEPKSREE